MKNGTGMFGRLEILLIVTKIMFHLITCNRDVINICHIERSEEFNVKRLVGFFPGEISPIILITLNPEIFFCFAIISTLYFIRDFDAFLIDLLVGSIWNVNLDLKKKLLGVFPGPIKIIHFPSKLGGGGKRSKTLFFFFT